MDKLIHYQHLIKQFMSEFAKLANQPPSQGSEMMCLFDDEHQQYALLKVGWTKLGRLHHTSLHVHLSEDKIWVEEDWTEEGIAHYLRKHGVPKEELVLAFHPPEWRGYSESV
jgi:hypothetical protein